MKQISMYFKSDFTVILASEGEWGGAPFRLKLWTASPAEGRSIKAFFDGEVWHNCRLIDDGRLQISVNQGDLGERQYMGIGTLKMDIELYLSNADFNDNICNEHIKTFEPVFEDENGEQYKLFLDNQGASTLTTYGTLPAFYQKGDKGDPGGITPEELQAIQTAINSNTEAIDDIKSRYQTKEAATLFEEYIQRVKQDKLRRIIDSYSGVEIGDSTVPVILRGAKKTFSVDELISNANIHQDNNNIILFNHYDSEIGLGYNEDTDKYTASIQSNIVNINGQNVNINGEEALTKNSDPITKTFGQSSPSHTYSARVEITPSRSAHIIIDYNHGEQGRSLQPKLVWYPRNDGSTPWFQPTSRAWIDPNRGGNAPEYLPYLYGQRTPVLYGSGSIHIIVDFMDEPDTYLTLDMVCWVNLEATEALLPHDSSERTMGAPLRLDIPKQPVLIPTDRITISGQSGKEAKGTLTLHILGGTVINTLTFLNGYNRPYVQVYSPTTGQYTTQITRYTIPGEGMQTITFHLLAESTTTERTCTLNLTIAGQTITLPTDQVFGEAPAIEVDTTLTKAGMAADAKAVGDRAQTLQSGINSNSTAINTLSSQVSDKAENADMIEGFAEITAALATKQDKVFEAIYGTTSYDDVLHAYEAGKDIIVRFMNKLYRLCEYNSGGMFYFGSSPNVYHYTVQLSTNGVWKATNGKHEITTNKVTTLTAQSTDEQYPSAKAVYDSDAALMEEVSHKVATINGSAPDASGNINVDIITPEERQDIQDMKKKVEDLETSKDLGVVVIGELQIHGSQVRGFSASDYLMMPRIIEFGKSYWQLDFQFTTGDDVQAQQNIIDSAFGLALAIAHGKLEIAISSNGTSWNLGAHFGTRTLQPNTSYFVRMTFNGSKYEVAVSTDRKTYTTDITVNSTASLYPVQIYIGKSPDGTHIFEGSIYLYYAALSIKDEIVWTGTLGGELKDELRELSNTIGDKTQLITQDKTSLVGAINEIATRILNIESILQI